MRIILNSVDERNGRFELQPSAEGKFTRLRCAKVTLPNTVEYAHPSEDLRFTTYRSGTTQDYVISLEGCNSNDGNFWATFVNNKLSAEGITDWNFSYDEAVGKMTVVFEQNGTDKVVFTKACRLFGIKQGETMTHVAYNGGKLSFTQQVGMSWPSVTNFIVQVTDANENTKYLLTAPAILSGKAPQKDTPADLQTLFNTSYASIPSTTGGAPWVVSWAVTSAGGDNINFDMSWASHPTGLSGIYQLRFFYTNANGHPETSETGLSSFYTSRDTTVPLLTFNQVGTIKTNYVDPINSPTEYEKTLVIPATEHTQADMVSLINGLGIDGLTVSATGTNQYTLSYVRRATPTLDLYETGVLSIFSETTVAGWNGFSSYELNPFLASPATLVITLPASATRANTFFGDVVNLLPYNHAYVTCSIQTQECLASCGNEAVIAEVPHAGEFMERHHYENNSPYFLPITRQDALANVQIGIIDDLGRDLKSRLRGGSYLVVLEME